MRCQINSREKINKKKEEEIIKKHQGTRERMGAENRQIAFKVLKIKRSRRVRGELLHMWEPI